MTNIVSFKHKGLSKDKVKYLAGDGKTELIFPTEQDFDGFVSVINFLADQS